MPIYVYQSITPEKSCGLCASSFERFQSFSEATLTECPECHAPIHRIIQPVGMRVGKKHLLTDDNVKKHGFTKLVNEGGGKFRKI